MGEEEETLFTMGPVVSRWSVEISNFLIHGCFEGDIVGVSKSSPRKKFNTSPPSFDKVLSVAPGTSYISQH